MLEILNFQSTPYFAFGQEQKSSLIAQFCRQNKYQHIKNPILEAVQEKSTHNSIIEGSLQLFKQLQGLRPELQVVFVGSKFTDSQIEIRRDYRKIGKCIQVRQLKYETFRKSMFPNLIFFYGPIEAQNSNCAHALAGQIGYCTVHLPQNANIFIKQFKKSVNYVVSGLFTSKQQLVILEQYFKIKVIHLQYNRIDLPQRSQYFDKQFQLISFLKSKTYYHTVSGLSDDIKVIDDVSEAFSPRLIYAQLHNIEGRQYLDSYLHRNEQDTLILSIFQIQSINKRKNYKLADTPYQKTNLLNQILYRDFGIKKAIVIDYPFLYQEIYDFQSANRKFQIFIDLIHPSKVLYFKEFTTAMYFLQQQKRIVPDTRKPLQDYLERKAKYWLVNGPTGSGKTTIAKYLSAQYGFKLIEYEPYFAAVKEKLLGPDGGEQVPLVKVLDHFKTLLNQNPNDIYVIDGLPFDNKDLNQWIRRIGSPSVINLEVTENQSIKRTRKKNQADVNAQVGEQEMTKAKQSQARSQSWLEKVRGMAPTVQIHELNYNSPIILSEKSINQIFRKNVYLVQNHSGLAFQNIALKYNKGFVNLFFTPLRQSLNIVKKMPNKDVILSYYYQTQQKLVSEDMYWIQKNIGPIRYVGVWQPEDTECQEEKIQLQKPQIAQKPKVQGAQGQQKPVQEQATDKKKQFDIYSYEWTRSQNPKNMSQWFLKSCKNVVKISSTNIKEVFEKWRNFVGDLQKSKDATIYQTFY